jgi:hypothetical protein
MSKPIQNIVRRLLLSTNQHHQYQQQLSSVSCRYYSTNLLSSSTLQQQQQQETKQIQSATTINNIIKRNLVSVTIPVLEKKTKNVPTMGDSITEVCQFFSLLKGERDILFLFSIVF